MMFKQQVRAYPDTLQTFCNLCPSSCGDVAPLTLLHLHLQQQQINYFVKRTKKKKNPTLNLFSLFISTNLSMQGYPGKSLNSNRAEKLQTQILHKELEIAVTSRCKESLQYLRSHQHENRKKQAFFSAFPNSLQYSTGSTR